MHKAGVVELENERGVAVPIRASEKTWVPVVVIDHPGHEAYAPTTEAVVLLRRDWEFLFEQLKSTYAVVEYLARVHAKPGTIELGREAIRYYELAAADVGAPPGRWIRGSERRVVRPHSCHRRRHPPPTWSGS